MTIQIVRLGTSRKSKEGIRIGTVRRPPLGVKKNEYISQNWYDVWLPNIAPTTELMKLGQAAESDKNGQYLLKNIVKRCPTLKRAEYLMCLPYYLTQQISRWVVTAKMKLDVTGPFFENY